MRSGRSLISYVGIEWNKGDPFIPELYEKLKENGKFDKIRFPETAGIGILFVDMMRSLPELFTEDEVKEVLALGYLNGLFVLGCSIGFIGHIRDQKRLKAGLYRHPWDDVLYQ